jgi:outer membrane protein W
MNKIKINKWGKIGILSTLAIGILFIAGSAMATESAVWTTLDVSGGLTDNLTLNVSEELRFADATGPSLARQHTDIGVSWNIDGISALGGYRNTSSGEHRPYVGVGLRLLSGDLNLDSATRLELRDFDTLRGRTELTVTASVGGVTPWLSDELFVDDSGVTGNRASVGVTKGLNDTVAVRAYYLVDSAIGDSTSNTHVLGLGLSVGL